MIELHTSDLTAACLRAVQLRHEGKVIASGTEALVKGSLFGACAQVVHERGKWAMSDAPGIVVETAPKVRVSLAEENRPVSEAVAANWTDILAEVERHVAQYIGRFAGYFASCKLIGCEVPIRATWDVDGEPVDFASHLDLFFRDTVGDLWVWDWKFRKEGPTPQYLARNMQFGGYSRAVETGEVLIDGEWVGFGTRPRLAWIHAPSLLPYGRGGTAGERSWKKGEARPLDTIVRAMEYTNAPAFDAEFATRVRLMRANLWPTNPDPIGCKVCESKHECPSFAGVVNEGSDDGEV